MNMNRRRAIIGLKKGKLPNEYQEVEYLQSTGTQYINTGYILQSMNFSVDAELSIDNTYPGSYGEQYFFGVFNNLKFFRAGTYQGYWYAEIGYSSGTISRFKNLTAVANTRTHIILGNNSSESFMEINGTRYTNTVVTDKPTKSIFFFGISNNGSLYTTAPFVGGKFYSFKIKDDGILVRDFIPCYRKSDGVAGMYDTVNEVFHTNAGSGTFTIGQNVGSDGLYILQDGILRNGFTMQTYRGAFTYYSGEVLGLRGTSLLGTNTVVLGNEKLDLQSYRYLRGRGCSSGSSASDFYLAISPTSSTATPIYTYFNWTDWNIVTLDLANYASGNYRLNTGTSNSQARLRDVWLTNTLTA